MKKATNTREGNPRHLKYFNGTDNIRLIGFGTMVGSGALLVWIWYIWWSYLFYLLAIGLFPVGLVLFIIGSIGKSTDEDIDRLISRLAAEADIDEKKDADIIRQQLRTPLPEVVFGYDYSDGLMFKKSKSGVVRSEIFKRATLLPLKDGLCVLSANVDIPRETVQRDILTLPYADIEDIRVISERKNVTFSKKSFLVNDIRLEIISHGETLFSLPAKESATLDAFIKRIKERNL